MKPARIHPMELALAAGGAVLMAGLFLPWADGRSSFASFDALTLLLALAAAAAVAVPVVVAASRLTDVPIVWETLLWLAALLLLVAFLIVVFLTPPSFTHGSGTWLSLVGLVVIGLTGWRCVRREY